MGDIEDDVSAPLFGDEDMTVEIKVPSPPDGVPLYEALGGSPEVDPRRLVRVRIVRPSGVNADRDASDAGARAAVEAEAVRQGDAAVRHGDAAEMAAVPGRHSGMTQEEYDEAYRRGVEGATRVRGASKVAAGADRARAEALRAGGRLVDLVSHAPVGSAVTPEMRSLAAACSILGGRSSESRPGRAFARDLAAGGLYVAKGWAAGEWEWTYVGPAPGDPSRMTVRRADGRTSVELLGDHGLAPYDEAQQGRFWHPTNWTEGTGVGESTGRMVSDAAGRDVGSVGMPLGRDDDEF